MVHIVSNIFEKIADFLQSVIFFDVLFFIQGAQLPFVIAWIIAAVFYFSFKLNFVNVRMLGKSVSIFFEKEKEIDGNKAITSKAAFLSAIAGCVGVGNISGVAAAIFAGGPGAVFWMFIIGFLLMPLRYAEVFLGHYFRTKDAEGNITQYGPYAYIDNGLKQKGYGDKFRKTLSFCFSVGLILGSVGAVTMQVTPTAELIGHIFFDSHKVYMLGFCLVFGILALLVVAGGLRRIAHVAERLVSIMAVVYLLSIALILGMNINKLPQAFGLIFSHAFELRSIYGGVLGTIVASFVRIIVATEVGFGTVALLHGKSQNPDSVREGLLAMTAPFFANFIFIILNSFAVIATGSYLKGENGILMISGMFAGVFSYFPVVLAFILLLFGFTTVTTWYFYAESGIKQISRRPLYVLLYRVLFFAVIICSGLVSFGVMLRLIDALTVIICIPNIIALYLLSGVVKQKLNDYGKK